MSVHEFKCIDAHTCGNPVRVVVGGAPGLSGSTIAEKRVHFLKEFDWIRTGLMFEPRGHDMMSGSILYPPHDSANDFAILFIETSGCLPMCGHGTIGTITVAIEKGLVAPRTPGRIRMEAPAGLVEIEYHQSVDGKVEWVELTNVKSYLAGENLTVDSPELGELVFDVAYGGNFYAIVDPQENFRGIEDHSAGDIVRFSRTIRERINLKYRDRFVHPELPAIQGVSHILWTGKPVGVGSSGRNAVFYGDKAIDRSPCGTGTSARMAQLHFKGKLDIGRPFVHESYIGSIFVGTIVQCTSIGPTPAIVPKIRGWAKIYGENTITIDASDDPYAHGFQVD